MRGDDLLRALFQAHRDGDDSLFVQTAQAIITRELAANHHGFAQQLIKALGATKKRESAQGSLTRLPQRTSAEGLITYPDQRLSEPEPILPAETRQKLDRIILENRRSDRLFSHGLWPTNRLLFWGPPGCGKTMTASYVARELGLPFGIVDLSALITGLLGATANQVAKVFSTAKSSPMVLLLDEFDALGKERNDELEIGEPKRVVNSLLQNLDDFQGAKSVIVAASNHQHLLDSAVWRRFDVIVAFPMPTAQERQLLLQTLTAGVNLVGPLSDATKASAHMSYADITVAVRYALKTMALEKRRDLSIADLLVAIRERRTSLSQATAARTMGNEQRTAGTRTKKTRRP
jgi:SpoVK/Ycf46/Vps4 family AAA+-type ATPase